MKKKVDQPRDWIPAGYDDRERKLLWAASEFLNENKLPLCPLCAKDTLRFYYHEFGIVSLPRRRGTIWVWCSQCVHWEHISGIELPKRTQYSDPLDNRRFGEIDDHDLIDSLDRLWEKGILPRVFAVEKNNRKPR